MITSSSYSRSYLSRRSRQMKRGLLAMAALLGVAVTHARADYIIILANVGQRPEAKGGQAGQGGQIGAGGGGAMGGAPGGGIMGGGGPPGGGIMGGGGAP